MSTAAAVTPLPVYQPLQKCCTQSLECPLSLTAPEDHHLGGIFKKTGSIEKHTKDMVGSGPVLPILGEGSHRKRHATLATIVCKTPRLSYLASFLWAPVGGPSGAIWGGVHLYGALAWVSDSPFSPPFLVKIGGINRRSRVRVRIHISILRQLWTQLGLNLGILSDWAKVRPNLAILTIAQTLSQP